MLIAASAVRAAAAAARADRPARSPLRVAASVALLAPFGLALGDGDADRAPRLRGPHPAGVPWAWGINGISSVLASVLAVAVAINFGFAVATLVALACYLGALAHALLGRWPRARPPRGRVAAEPARPQVMRGLPATR